MAGDGLSRQGPCLGSRFEVGGRQREAPARGRNRSSRRPQVSQCVHQREKEEARGVRSGGMGKYLCEVKQRDTGERRDGGLELTSEACVLETNVLHTGAGLLDAAEK